MAGHTVVAILLLVPALTSGVRTVQAAEPKQAPSLSEAAVEQPNILLIITDQQSADAMSCWMGNQHIHTPVMDGLAATGTRFTRAYCAHPVCVPSRASMLSGRYPQETGILSFRDKGNDYASFPSLGRIFKQQGYDTGYVGKWHVPMNMQKERSAHGFDHCENNGHNGVDLTNSDVAIRFIRESRDNPFLLVVSYNNPHNICEWARGVRGERLPDGDFGDPPPMTQCPPLRENHLPPEDETDIIALMRRSYHASAAFPVGAFGEGEWREYAWAYYRMIELVDKRIGEVLTALRESGQDENTVIVFTSDHGDCQGAHRWNQKTTFYDESSRVPFIVNYPGKTTVRVSEHLVHTGVDLIPTLCDYAGIPVPGGLPGISLAPLATGKNAALSRPYLVTQTRFLQGAEIDGKTPKPGGRMVRSKRYKYCVYDTGDHRESLVDMDNDPGEMVNLARKEDHRAILQQHRKYLAEWCQKYDDDFPVPGN